MSKVTSPDGTSIAYYRSGEGPPLILIAGTAAANPVAWTGVLPTLEGQFSVYAMDRRGRGQSGDHPVYAIEREFEDIAAVVDSMEEPAFLLGHSFGALCVLEAALLTRNIRKLILYEPALSLPNAPIYREGVIDRLRVLLDAGNSDAVLTAYYREVVKLQSQDIEQLRSSPFWSERVATVHTLPREAEAEEQYRFDEQRFRALQTSTLFLLGGESPPFLKAATEIISRALPNKIIAVMPGQQHLAMYTAPDLFLDHLLAFLEEG